MQAINVSAPADGAPPPRTVTYQVAARRGGKWDLAASHAAGGRSAALAAAQDLDGRPGVEAVTVTKETWYHDTDAVAEMVIWRSSSLAQELAASRARQPRYAHAEVAARMASLSAPRPAAIAAPGSGQRIAAMLGSFALACGAGGLAAILLSAALTPASAASADGTGIEGAVATMVFLVATAGAFVVLARRLVPRPAPATVRMTQHARLSDRPPPGR